MNIKLAMDRKYIMLQMLVMICCFLVSCTSDDNNLDTANDLYLNIPDARFEFILIELGIDMDNEINQQILKTDAKGVSSLNLDFNGNGEINDLTGIEGFIGLKYLSAIQNSLTEIDLSANTLLDSLFLQGNRFTSFDISDNPNLIMVDLTSNFLNSFTGTSEVMGLKNLRLSFNDLEEFSIDNESIENLLISHNLLQSINTEGSVNLKHILLRTNKITSIDFSSNTLLETLVLSDNRIQNLNLEQNSKLTHLYISSNSLTNLDVSNLQDLLDLKVDRNPDLTCIKIQNDQNIPAVSISDDQELSDLCN